MKKTIFFAAALLFLLSTIFLLYNLLPHELGSHNTVTISEKGFTPDFVRISSGTTITWINQDEQPHWPASDFHPTHNQYPSEKKGCLGSFLDACRAMNKGEQYSFTFHKKDVWGIHDHLYPGMSMTVEVTDNLLLASIRAFVISLFKTHPTDLPSSNSFLTLDYPEQLKTIKETSSKDPKKTWAYLKETYLKDDQKFENSELFANALTGVNHVHAFAHIVGNEAYKLYGIDALSFCDYRFTYGCLHGVSEQMMLELGMGAIDKCGGLTEPRLCNHGLGHGLLLLRGYDVQSAVKDCDMLKAGAVSCYGGLFMEYGWSAPKEQLKRTNPIQLCASFPEQQARSACSVHIITYLMRAFDWSFGRAAEECFNAQDENIIQTECAAGQQAAGFSGGNLDKIRKYCASLKGKRKYPRASYVGISNEDFCLAHAAIETKHLLYYDWRNTTTALCNEVSETIRDLCLYRLSQKPQPLSIAYRYNASERGRALGHKEKLKKILPFNHEIIEFEESEIPYEDDVLILVNKAKRDTVPPLIAASNGFDVSLRFVEYLETGERPTAADVIIIFGGSNDK